ncbi:LysR family transcriptional regulator [Kitasatospora sp. NPDC005748]|uniref:LysR family transcriptional regulator n=1 Tax=Kitasatospora sp. NPDC005748 TaxID=3157063 RepID=UPI0033D4E790
MELRDIEIFLALAEELHFGRTAERLHISPARVSQAIRKQERSVGAMLFERTSRTVRLTEVGRQLRDDLRPCYQGLQDSLERARMAAQGVSGRLRVLMMPFNVGDLHVYWKTFRKRHPQWELQVRLSVLDDPFGKLRDGECDVFVAWLPVEEPDLTVGPTLFTDPRILAVAADHPLGGRSSVRLENLADFPQGSGRIGLDYWEEGYLPFTTPKGRPIERAYQVTHSSELIDLVAMGDIVQPFPSHVTRYWGMPDVRWLPITDLAPLSFALVWRNEAEDDAIRALAATVRDLGVFAF